MRFRTPAFAFIVEAFTHKHKNAEAKTGKKVADEPAITPNDDPVIELANKPLPIAPIVPKAPKPPAVLAAYQVDEAVAKNLSEKDITDLKEAFSLFDTDGDGVVTALDLGRVMHSLGQDPTYSELQSIIHDVDADGNGTIEFAEFMTVMAENNAVDSVPETPASPVAVSRKSEEDVELRNAFKLFDLDKNGFIDVAELKHIIGGLGNHVSDEEAADILREYDLDGDGRINYEEFVKMMISQ